MKDTGKAKLPGLVSPRVDNADLARWVQAVSERLEVREGSRGNPYERAVTVRDLTEGGIAVMGGGGRIAAGGPGGGAYAGYTNQNPDYEKFWEELKNSSLYRELMKRIDDPTRFDDLADEIKAVLLRDIAEEARLRGADIRRLDTKIQSESRALAMSVLEVTAAVQDAAAGVRQTQLAQASATQAIAGQITQVQSKLDDKVATVEETLKTTADAVTGLKSEYFVKVAAGGAFGGFGLSAVSPADSSKPAYSQFLIAADKFAIVSPDGSKNPFGIDSSGIYLNGQVRINANGQQLADLTNDFYLTASGQVFNQNPNTSALSPSSITVTANLKGAIAGKVATFSSTPSGLVTANGNTATVASSALATNTSVKVTASLSHNGATYTDEFTLYKVVDGADALVGFLTNESHAVPADSSGTVSGYAGASGKFVVFQGSVELKSDVAFSKVSSDPSGLVANISDSGVYSVSGGLTADSGTVTFRAAIGGQNIDKVFTISRQKQGMTGGYTLYQYAKNTSETVPPPTSAFGSEAPTLGTGEYLWMRAGRVIPPATTVAPSDWGAPYRVSGEQGVRGSITAYGTSEGWSDFAARSLILNIAKTGGLRIGDTVTLSNSAKTWSQTKYWGGTAWMDPGVTIDGNLLVNGTISGSKINADSAFITKVKAVEIDASKITSGKISADRLEAVNITASQISNALSTAAYKFSFGDSSTLLGYAGAGYFTANSYSGAFALGAWNSGVGPALAAGHSSGSGTAALFSSGGVSYWTTATKLCSTDEFSGKPTAGVFMHGSNRGNVALLGRQDQAGYFYASGGASKVSIGEGSTAINAEGAVNIYGTLKVNNVEIAAGGGSVDGKDIKPRTVVSSGGITTTGGSFSAEGSGGYYGAFGSFGGSVVSYGNYGTTTLGSGSYVGFSLGLNTTLSVLIQQHLGVKGNVLIDGALQVKGKTLAFTGAHPGLIGQSERLAVGDILVDHQVVSKLDISNTVTLVRPSSAKNQKGVIGVYSGENTTMPAALTADASIGGAPAPKFASLLATHKIVDINAVGEGQINVCGENGDLEIGDLIVSSSMPGKGMRQMKDGQVDDLVRSYTVAKCREKVTFTSPTEVKMVACIYLCG